MKLYNLFVKSTNGKKVYLTASPMTHKECEIMAQKCLDQTRPNIQFEDYKQSNYRGV